MNKEKEETKMLLYLRKLNTIPYGAPLYWYTVKTIDDVYRYIKRGARTVNTKLIVLAWRDMLIEGNDDLDYYIEIAHDIYWQN